MAKDTEKLIRQLSLISFLMAERRPVSALEIKQDVEGYSQMNDEAFARRFYADRAELEALGIQLKVDKPAEGYYEAENYSLPPENFYLPAIEFTSKELGALHAALSLLDGEFAYAEPLRLALQQLSWGKASPLDAPEERSVALAVTASPGGRDLSQRLSKVETAIFRRKTIVFDYYTIGRDATESRKVDPYHLLYRGGQFYLIGHSHERGDIRVFRVSRIRGKVGYASKAEHDFSRPEEFDPRQYADRTDWQLGDPVSTARIWISDRIDWLVLRHFEDAGRVSPAEDDDGVIFETEYADSRQMVSWVLGLGPRARSSTRRSWWRRPTTACAWWSTATAASSRRPARQESVPEGRAGGGRGERQGRLADPARALRPPGDPGRDPDRRGARRAKLHVADLCERLHLSEQELRQDIDVLNVVNFGGGSYVLYAEVQGDTIEVDPEPYGDNFARPARLLPLEAKALVAAIDLLGEHLPEGSLESARKKIVKALGQDPAEEGLQITTAKGDDSEIARVVTSAITRRRLLEFEHYKEELDEFTTRRVEPYKLMNGREGWYVHCWDPEKDQPRSFRLDRIREATVLDEKFEPREGVEPDIQGWPSTGEVPDSRLARVWISPERARWAREDQRVVQELSDGAVIVEFPYAGHDYLGREILKEAGDAVVLEPEEAREAVLHAAEALAGAASR